MKNLHPQLYSLSLSASVSQFNTRAHDEHEQQTTTIISRWLNSLHAGNHFSVSMRDAKILIRHCITRYRGTVGGGAGGARCLSNYHCGAGFMLSS